MITVVTPPPPRTISARRWSKAIASRTVSMEFASAAPLIGGRRMVLPVATTSREYLKFVPPWSMR